LKETGFFFPEMLSDLTLSLSSLRVAQSECLPKGHCAKEQFHGIEQDGMPKNGGLGPEAFGKC